jgi:hypothetical protein
MPKLAEAIKRHAEQSAKRTRKAQFSDVKRLMKLMKGMGSEVTVDVTPSGYSVSTSAPAAEAQPVAVNEWDEVLK